MRIAPFLLRSATLLAVAVAPLLTACDQSATSGQLHARAAHDLRCPATERYVVHKLDARTVIVNACGRQNTYVESCATCWDPFAKRTVACDCTWLNDTPSSPAPAGASRSASNDEGRR